ncbi:MAG: hypothetical protein KQJ78_08545 [Deltaproteobacteria bacterium]|nr:hypothetical protein [Deltaproteobacteria bacterium]
MNPARPAPPFPPLPINSEGSNFARKAWWRAFELTPGVTLATTARLRPSLAQAADSPRHLAAAVTRAASAALTLHPRLNYFTFWGRLVWAGLPPRIGVVMENPDLSCAMVTLTAAHLAGQAEVMAQLGAREGMVRRPTARAWLREHLPLPAYLAERASGVFVRDYCRLNGPLFLSLLALRGIEEVTFTPAHSMALFPLWPEEERLKLILCFNHQLANARPVGRFLLTIKHLLEA